MTCIPTRYLTQSVRTPEHNQQQNMSLCGIATCVPRSQLSLKWFIALCVWLSFRWHPMSGSTVFWLCRLFNEKEQWQVTSQTDWDKENEEVSQGVQHFWHLLVKSHGGLDSEGTAAEMPPTKMWQRSGMGHPSKEDGKGHPLVEEHLERQQIPITHIIR